LELEAVQKEQVRLAGVRSECWALDAACKAALGAVRDVVVQQLAATELREVVARLEHARESIAARPDQARRGLVEVQQGLHATIAQAEARAKAWSAAQAEVVARARALVEHSAIVMKSPGGAVIGDSAKQRALEALRRAESGDLAGAQRTLPEAETELEATRAAVLDESIRREVVRGLLETLRTMGFIAEPRLKEGVVVLDGRLASGRSARFEVSLEGKMEFDLDGYEGRACADDLEKVETALRDSYGVKLGPAQVVWKNPDRLSRGAKDHPTGRTNKEG